MISTLANSPESIIIKANNLAVLLKSTVILHMLSEDRLANVGQWDIHHPPAPNSTVVLWFFFFFF